MADMLAVQAGPASAAVVLVPFAQLLPLARKAWIALGRSGFSPRFETTQSWAARLGPAASTAPADALYLSFDPAPDLLVAQQLLATARAPASLSAAALLEATTELARRVCAAPPEDRPGWLAARRAALPLPADSLFAPDATLARLALEWACATRHAADALWQAMRSGAVRHVFVLQGLQPDPLVQAWQQQWPQRITVLPLLPAHHSDGSLQIHQATDVEDEAQRAAACVIRHLQAGRMPVAVASTDRVVSRRVQALLAERGIGVRDETGWRLSTTRAAATLWRTVELWSPEPSTDGVIDWLQHVARQSAAVGAPAAVAPDVVAQLEARARKIGQPRWAAFAQAVLADGAALGTNGVQGANGSPQTHVAALVQQVERWRVGEPRPEGRPGPQSSQVRSPARRPLSQWLLDLRDLLQLSGLWDGLQGDAAGAQVLDALRLLAHGSLVDKLADLPVAARPMPWSAWAQWLRAVLE
ncbi:MAG: PD-(D/E)XK nuclease family protein, partial [Burkholderiaceae bacterium]